MPDSGRFGDDEASRGSSRARPGGSARPLGSGPRRPTVTPRRAGSQRVPDSSGTGYVDAYGRPIEERFRDEPVYRYADDDVHDQRLPDNERFDAPGLGEAPTRRRTPQQRTYTRRPRWQRLLVTLIVLVLIVGGGWVVGLGLWGTSRIERVDALSGAADTPGTTWLLAGSDARDQETIGDDGTEGQRTDTMMLLHRAPNGSAYLVSLPRDMLAEVPGHGSYKLNAAFAFGGAPLLVETVEGFAGLTVDHYVEVGFDAITSLTDAVGGVELCLDQDVDDPKSGLVWEAGCHVADGETALSFVRARDFDPTADLGRIQRQQQFISALMGEVVRPLTLLNPVRQVRLVGAGAGSITASEGTGLLALGKLATTLRSAQSATGNSGAPVLPIADPEYRTRHSGIAIQVDDDEVAEFFAAVGDGSLDASPEG